MTPGLSYPTPEEVEAAGRAELRFWLNELPGDGGDDAKWALMQRIIARLADMRQQPYAQHQGRPFAAPLQDPAVSPMPKPPRPAKTPPKPKDTPSAEAAPPGYFASLFS